MGSILELHNQRSPAFLRGYFKVGRRRLISRLLVKTAAEKHQCAEKYTQRREPKYCRHDKNLS